MASLLQANRNRQLKAPHRSAPFFFFDKTKTRPVIFTGRDEVLNGDFGDLDFGVGLTMAEADQVALLRLVFDALDLVMTILVDDFPFDNRLFKDGSADMGDSVIPDKEHFKFHNRVDFGNEFFNLDPVPFGDLVLFSAGSDNREHMPLHEPFRTGIHPILPALARKLSRLGGTLHSLCLVITLVLYTIS